MPIPVGIALGSNVRDRRANLEAGFVFLASLAVDGVILRSPVIETAPQDCPPGSEAFLNAVGEILLDSEQWPPERLLITLQEFEQRTGRAREHERNAPRCLDLDIIYYGGVVMKSPALTIPHPRVTERRFVLEPLVALRPELVLPGQSRTVSELLDALPDEPPPL